jgi:hypothetical protein
LTSIHGPRSGTPIGLACARGPIEMPTNAWNLITLPCVLLALLLLA